MTEQELVERANDYLRRIVPAPVQLPVEPIMQTIADLRGPNEWPDWCGKPGVYFFVHNDEVVYVGRALPSHGLGNRIGTHIAVDDDSEWGRVVADGSTRVGAIPFGTEDDWHWLAALEFWLIDSSTRPRFNRKF